MASAAVFARDPDPVVRIPLDTMGYQAMVPEFLLSGSSMLTVDYVDRTHLLVTFSLRRLMKRESDDPPDDEDRTVGAYLLELPSGKLIAQTEWRLHDRGQYLWALGHGRFLLRIRDRLTSLTPMAAATPEQAFQQSPFLRNDRRVLAIMVSAEQDLLTIETAGPPSSADVRPRFAGDAPPAQQQAFVQINFYRLPNAATGEKLVVASAGVIRSRAPLNLPLTTAGYLDVLEGGRDRWLFNFDSHEGKVSELAEFHTTCYPRITFVSHTEFVAFGCRGSSDKQNIAGFNLKGEEMWQQNFYDTHIVPTFAFAPSAGRFALGRTLVGGSSSAGSPVSPDMASSQEVRVYQTYNGKQIFRTDCTPIVRAGQNFALSPDGMSLAVVRETTVRHPATRDDEAYVSRTAALEIYALPPLSKDDEAMVKQALILAPADGGSRIDLALQRISQQDSSPAPGSTPGSTSGSSSGADALAASAPAAPPAASLPAAVQPDAAPASTQDASASASGDPQPSAPRKPPTLYAPGETSGAANGKAQGNTSPQ
jgi:hypothetical protein